MAMPVPGIGSLVDNGTLELVSLIGQGGFASVYLARSTATDDVFALKVLHRPPPKTNDDEDQDEQTPLPHHVREARLHSLCSSPDDPNSSITPLLKTIIHPTTTTLYTCLLLPYYPSGDLFMAILTHKMYLANPPLIKSTFMQILNGVYEAHSRGIFLRDLKPENCLLDEDGRVHLCDFGLATEDLISEEFRTGSVYHMSPECMGPHPYSPRQSDIWSLGILLLNLLTSRNPWREASMNDPTFAAYFHSHPAQPSRSSHSQPILLSLLPISERIADILHQILHPAPSERLTLEEMLLIFDDLSTDMDEWYDPKAIFDWEGGCARCTWEIGEAPCAPEEETPEVAKSVWSVGSDDRSLRLSVISPAESLPSPLFELERPASLAGSSAHTRASSSSSDNSASSPLEFSEFAVSSTPMRTQERTGDERSWKVLEDTPPPVSPSPSSQLSPSPSYSQPSTFTSSFSASYVECNVNSRNRKPLAPIFTANASVAQVDSNGVPRTPKDVLASLGVDVKGTDTDSEQELGVAKNRDCLVQHEDGSGLDVDEIPVIEWVDRSSAKAKKKAKEKGGKKKAKHFLGGILSGRILFGGGDKP